MARALFIGVRSPITAGALAGWLASGNEVAAFWSAAPGVKPDRFGTPRLSPARLLARHGIPNIIVPRLSKWPGLLEAVDATGADLLIVCATQMIIPDPLLDRFGARTANVHPAMLPEYRGPWPYLPMLLDGRGDSHGGVTIHVLSSRLDEGDIIAQEHVPYSNNGANFTDWYAALILATYRLMRDALPSYLDGTIEARPQRGGSYHRVDTPMRLDPALTADEIRGMLERAGSTLQLAVALPVRERGFVVSRVIRTAGRSGQPPRLGPLTIEMDVADARLTLARVTGVARQWEKWRLAWALRSLQL